MDFASVKSRSAWVEDVVRCEWLEVVERAEWFWREALSPDRAILAWVCFDDAAEYCGFLEFVWRIGETPFQVIDATGLEFTRSFDRKWTPRTLGVLQPEQMIEAGLFGRAKPLSPEVIEHYRQTWRRMRKENAPLRIVSPAGLVSAPTTHFNSLLMRYATNEWRRGAQVVGEALGELWESAASPHASDLWLWGRVLALAEQGVLDVEGDVESTVMEMRKTRIRRSSRGAQE